jgi:hypothetical protein
MAFLTTKAMLAIIPVSLLISSCTSSDIKTAKEFGAILNKMRLLNTSVANDIYDSCTRSSAWIARGTPGTRNNMRDALKVCDTEFRPNSVRTEIAGNVLTEYIGAIDALATEDRSTVKTRFEEIGSALGGLKVQSGDSTLQLKQNTIDTGVRIATFLTNLILNDVRRKNLKAAIVCTDADIQAYSIDLAIFINELYIKALLDDEIDSVTRYFGGYRSPLTNKTNLLLDTEFPETFTSLQNTQLKRDQDLRSEISKIVEKKNMGGSYVTLIQATATAHSDLKNIFNKGSNELSPKLQVQCKEYFNKKQNRVAVNNPMENNFLNQEISKSELEKIRKISREYTIKVKPILSKFNQ